MDTNLSGIASTQLNKKREELLADPEVSGLHWSNLLDWKPPANETHFSGATIGIQIADVHYGFNLYTAGDGQHWFTRPSDDAGHRRAKE